MIDVKAFREERGITARDMIDVARESYPKYDKYLHSKVERPDEYGVRPVLALESAWECAFASTAKKCHKRDNRRLKARIQCRMTQTEFERLQHAFRRDGYTTMQEGMSNLIKQYINKGEPNEH